MRIVFSILLISITLSACTPLPDGLKVVDNFELQRFLGTWYEIARYENTYEKGLSNITATYHLQDDGSLQVINKGFRDDQQRWESVKGKGSFIEAESIGRLKISFFGPFYSAFNILELDKNNYSYFLVCGNTRDAMWIMSRTPQMEESTLNFLIERLDELGFDTNNILYVSHQPDLNENSKEHP